MIVYLKEYEIIDEARREELRLKKMKSRKIIEELIDSNSAHSSAG